MTEIFMPKAGMDMKTGVLVRWLKEIGDPVEKDEPIMEIETDKITMEAEAPASGFLLATYCESGDTVPVLNVMGYIGSKDETPPANPYAAALAKPKDGDSAHTITAAAAVSVPPPSPAAGGLRATPYARHLAKERGLDLAVIPAGGKHGEITGADVLCANKLPQATPLAKRMADAKGLDVSTLNGTGHGGKVRSADVESALAESVQTGQLTVESRKPLSTMNRAVAARMMTSHTEIPSVTQSILVDMTDLFTLRNRLNERRQQKLSINDFVLKATAIAVKEHPKARTILVGNEYITYAQANIGFAVSVEDGLFVPVLHNADQMPLTALSAKAKELAERARNNQLRPDECSGGVFTVSNMGMFDVWDFTPIINPPEPGILGIGAAQEMLRFASDGSVVARKICKLFITYDHRIMDGVSSARIKLRVRDLLEHPEELLLI